MRCSKCGTGSTTGRKFCSECGTALPRGCLQCGADNAPTAKFCGECGAALSAPDSIPVTKTPPIQQRDIGERRHLTVLFCDLVGSTEISARLDPEEWREIEAEYLGGVAEAITRFGGYVAKYLGDGVLAYFGWPEAHDNDAERAARAGLAIIEGIAALNQRDRQDNHPKLSARVGSSPDQLKFPPKALADITMWRPFDDYSEVHSLRSCPSFSAWHIPCSWHACSSS
jgi:hypothetical protein